MTFRCASLSVRSQIAWMLSVFLALLLLSGCLHPSVPTPIKTPDVIPQVEAEFVGNEVCKDCHSAEFKTHQVSRHQTTLHPLDQKSLGALAPPAGSVPGTDIVLKEKEGQYFLTIPGETITEVGTPQESLPLQFAFGSGKTGMTYVSLVPDGELLEMRKSYFPREKRWYLTPGHERQPDYSIGLLYTREQARRCMLCHSTVLYDDNDGPKPPFRGVGCEACHGPASLHVTARRAGQTTDPFTAASTHSTASQQVAVCARCHRSADANASQEHPTSNTNRFQPYGLLQSRCYRESRDTLSCVTCHNPHENVATNEKRYEKVCLNCHSADPSHATTASGRGKPCPVNPKEKCIGCHMPSRPIFQKTDLPIRMADHFIRIYRDKR